MFVAKWSPGIVPDKPELSSAPIWLELRNVPYQFFNEDGLEQIASLVGDPKALHPQTANKTVLDVAKVFTVIDPRKPLPESVNVQFESGEVRKVDVSSPWMPPICSHCKDIAHSLRHCKKAPITCAGCRVTTHLEEKCPRGKQKGSKQRRQSRRRRSKTPAGSGQKGKQWAAKGFLLPSNQVKDATEKNPSLVQSKGSSLGEPNTQTLGETSKVDVGLVGRDNTNGLAIETASEDSSTEPVPDSEPERDSSDTLTSNGEEDAVYAKLDKRQQKVRRGKSLKLSP